MVLLGNHDRRGCLDRPQIFPFCFHKIARIACAPFRAIGAIIWKPGFTMAGYGEMEICRKYRVNLL